MRAAGCLRRRRRSEGASGRMGRGEGRGGEADRLSNVASVVRRTEKPVFWFWFRFVLSGHVCRLAALRCTLHLALVSDICRRCLCLCLYPVPTLAPSPASSPHRPYSTFFFPSPVSLASPHSRHSASPKSFRRSLSPRGSSSPISTLRPLAAAAAAPPPTPHIATYRSYPVSPCV